MQCVLNKDCLLVVFESDCSNMLNLVENQDDWPAFSYVLDKFNRLKVRFSNFVIYLILRCNSVCADTLPKEQEYESLYSPMLVFRLCFSSLSR